ncbi:MAG: GrpB family protein [Candidatus Sumerlaeaceae bacterium]
MSSSAAPLIYLSDYDPKWPQLFDSEAAEIATALSVPAGAVHHIGSTAVPDLRSKPLIDLLVTVPDVKSRDEYLRILGPLGYDYREVHDPGRLFFEKRRPFRYHLHVVEQDGWHYWRLVLFRDRLRRDPLTAAAYVELKRRLADQHPDNRDLYSGGKSLFVTRTVQAELKRYPELLARLRASGAPVDVIFQHKRDPDTESFPMT